VQPAAASALDDAQAAADRMATGRPGRPDGDDAARCPNCGGRLGEAYCGRCGQRAESRIVPLRDLGHDLIDNVLGLDLRLVRTLPPLFWRPGRVTADYLAGRRRRYVKPVRLLLLTAFALELVLSLYARTASDSTFITISDPDELEAEIDSLAQIDTRAARFEHLMADGVLRAYRNPARYQAELAGRFTLLAFVLLPVFALLLKALYWRRERLYAEHLVFAAHVHAFAFALLTLLLVAGAAADALAGAGGLHGLRASVISAVAWLGFLAVVPVHLFVALRRVYGQGVPKTLAKTAVLAIVYFFVGTIALVVYGLLVLALF
jgi:hypothetical protein